VLRRVESTDEGRYICVVTTEYGRSQAEAELTVSGISLLTNFTFLTTIIRNEHFRPSPAHGDILYV